MSDSHVEVKLDADIAGFIANMKRAERVVKGFNRLENRMMAGSGMNAYLSQMSKKNVSVKKSFDSLDQGVKMLGTGLSKFLTVALKGTIISMAAMGAAMLAIHAAFVVGGGLAKLYAGAMKIVAGGAAGLVVVLGTVAAAMREQQAAMFSFSGGGAKQFGSGTNQARVAMRALATDADLAGLGMKNINKTYAAMAKSMNSTQILGSKNSIKALFDFGAAGQDPAAAAEKIGVVVEALNNSKKSFGDVQTAAKALGPQMEKAMKDLGIKSKKQFQEALLSGELAKSGGVFGQFAEVNNTLIGRVKTFFNLIKEEFADFGQKFLEPAKVAMQKIFKTIQTSMMKVSGEISAFGSGQVFDGLVKAVEVVSNFFVNVIRKYLPEASMSVGGMGDTFEKMGRGWQIIVDKLRPFIDGAKVLEQVFKPIIDVIKNEGSKNFGKFNEELVANSEVFAEMGEKLAGLVEAAFEVGRTFRAMIMDSLPFLNDVLAGLTTLLKQLNGVKQIFGNMFGSTGGLMAFAIMARQMKQTQGGLMGTVKGTMTLTPHTVVINAPGAPPMKLTPGGVPNRYGGVGTAPTGTGTQPPGPVSSGKGLPAPFYPTPTGQQIPQNPKNPKTTPGQSRSGSLRFSFGGRQQYQLPENQLYSQTTGRALKRETTGMRLRALRGTAGGTALLGNKQLGIGGAANSMGAKMGVGMGLSMISQRAPQEMQGALALGGMVGMYNPMAGLAIAGLGSAASARGAGAGALAGGVGGAAVGGMIAGPVGAAIGGALGALGGALMGAANRFKQQAKEARDAINASVDRVSLETMRGVGDKLYANIKAVEEGRSTAGLGSSLSELMGFKKKTGKVFREATGIRDRNRAFTDEEMSGITGGSAADARKLLINDPQNKKLMDAYFKRTGLTSGAFTADATFEEADRRAQQNSEKEYKVLFQSLKTKGSEYGGFQLSEDELKKSNKSPEAAGKALITRIQTENNANILTMNQSNARLAQLRKMTGKTDAELEALAHSLGKNIHDPLITFTDLVDDLRITVVRTATEMRQANTDIYVSAGNAFESLIKQAKATEVVDEKAEAIRVAFASGNVKPNEIIEFMGSIQGSLLDKNMGDPLAAFGEFTSQIGTLAAPGNAFGKGGVFENIKIEDFLTGEAGAAYNTYTDQATKGFRGEAVTQIQSMLTSEGMTVDATRLNEALQGKTAEEQFKIYNALQNTAVVKSEALGAKFDFGGFGGVARGQEAAAAAGTAGSAQAILDLFNIDLTATSLGGDKEQAGKLDNIVNNLNTYSTGLQTQLGVVQEKTAQLFAGVNARPDWMAPDALKRVFIEAGIIKADTNTPRGQMVGDTTSSRLSQTMARHSSIDGMLTGKRSVTSAYRTTGLGSINSDHVTGRALDLVGPNLGQYKTLTDQAGGFAEFHGRGGNRHLHVVPGPGAMGDTTVPSLTQRPVSMTQSGGGGSTNYYTFQITGGNASPEDIANRVMAKIKDNARAEMER